jgi:hypothetical protein
MLNDAIANYRVEMIVLYIAADIASISVAYGVIDALGVTGSADLALALGISRLLRRFRMPLDVAVAALLTRVYPPLGMVKVTRLFSSGGGGASSPPPPAAAAAAPPAAPAGAGASAAAAPAAAAPAAPTLLERAKALADRYGLALLVSQRMLVGLASVGLIYALLRSGVDVQGWLASHELLPGAALPGAGATGELAGRYAAAMCLAALGYPGVVLGAA